MLKPLGNRPAVLLIDKVKLAFLCRAAGPNQFVVNPFENQPCQSVLHLRFLEIVERLCWHVDTGDLDSGIEHAEQRVFQRLKIVQPRRDSPGAVDLKVLDLVSRDSVSIRLGMIRRHVFSP